MTGRTEHLIVERIVPLMLIVVIPLLAVIYVGQRQDAQARKRQDIASCERGNIVRERQRQVLLLLARSQEHLAVHLTRDDAEAARGLRIDAEAALRLSREATPVDCQNTAD